MRILFAIAFSVILVQAQPRVGAGVKFGGQATTFFEEVHETGATGRDKSDRWAGGPAVELRLTDTFAVEGAALYRSVGRQSEGSYQLAPTTTSESGSAWEFPVVVKARLASEAGGVRPFVVAGPALRRVRTDWRSTSTDLLPGNDGQPAPVVHQSTGEFSDNDLGFTAGGGIEQVKGWLRLGFEVRYTRWFKEDSPLRVARPNQVWFGLTVGF